MRNGWNSTRKAESIWTKVGVGQAMVENTMEKQVCQRVMRRFDGGQKLQAQRAPLVEHVCVAKEEDNQEPRE